MRDMPPDDPLEQPDPLAVPRDDRLKGRIGGPAQGAKEPQHQAGMEVPEPGIRVPGAVVVNPSDGNHICLVRSVVPIDPGRLDAIASEATIDRRGKARILDFACGLGQSQQCRAVAIDKNDPMAMHPHHEAGYRCARDIVKPLLELQHHLAKLAFVIVALATMYRATGGADYRRRL